MHIRIIAALAALLTLQPVAARAYDDGLNKLFPGCVRAGNGTTLWRCSADSFKAELAEMNVNGGLSMTDDKPASRHHRGHSRKVADR